MAVNHVISEYTAVIRQRQADIHLYAGSTLVGSIYFLSDSSQLGAATQQDGRVVLRYALDQYAPVMDMLRNEKPVRLFYSSPTVAYISCGKEGVGEGE